MLLRVVRRKNEGENMLFKLVRRKSVVWMTLLVLGFLAGGTLQVRAKPTIDSGSKPPKTDFTFVPHPIGQLELVSGQGTKKAGKATELSSAETEATFAVPLAGLEPGTTVRVTVSASAQAGSAIPGLMVDGNRVGRGPEVTGEAVVTTQTVATLPQGEGSFSLTLAPQSKIRIVMLKAERLK